MNIAQIELNKLKQASAELRKANAEKRKELTAKRKVLATRRKELSEKDIAIAAMDSIIEEYQRRYGVLNDIYPQTMDTDSRLWAFRTKYTTHLKALTPPVKAFRKRLING